jgi:hypothetical protein
MALWSIYSTAYLDHANIIGVVADGQCHSTKAILDKLDEESFLQRGNSTADNTFALDGQPKQQILILLVA